MNLSEKKKKARHCAGARSGRFSAGPGCQPARMQSASMQSHASEHSLPQKLVCEYVADSFVGSAAQRVHATVSLEMTAA